MFVYAYTPSCLSLIYPRLSRPRTFSVAGVLFWDWTRALKQEPRPVSKPLTVIKVLKEMFPQFHITVHFQSLLNAKDTLELISHLLSSSW